MNMRREHDVIVVGGGPAGATTAAYMAKLGYKTLVLEKDKFPRHRIGESLLPSMMPILDDFDLIPTVEAQGFPKKTGGTFVWGKSEEPWDVFFAENPFLPYSYAYHVERSRFDKIMLDNAAQQGAEVIEHVSAKEPIMDGDRVVGVRYEDAEGQLQEARGRFVVDASGPASVIGRQVAQRQYDPRMKQVAFYRYYDNVKGPDELREGHVIVQSCPKGWFWYIPVDSEELGSASVGLVTGQEFKEEYAAMGKEAFFEEALKDVPMLQEMLGPKATTTQPMRAITDWAYACDRMAGPGFFLVGDAAAFLDPMLSTGVTMAMLAGYSASACLHTALSTPENEENVTSFYNTNYRRMWEVTRDFLHYFYAGNKTASTDDIFWHARGMLDLNDNVGAKQAFCFLVNTIPGNPHPAVNKQIHMFQQFMDQLDHPMEAMSCDTAFQSSVYDASGWVEFSDLEATTQLVVNGRLETSWTIDKPTHSLKPVRGVAYDQERPVFSSTSSWLLGKNLYALDDASCDFLERCDGQKTWGEVVAEFASEQGLTAAKAHEALHPTLEQLHANRFLLLRRASPVEVTSQAISTAA